MNATEARSPVHAARSDESKRSARILVVDDDFLLRVSLEAILNRAGYNTTSAAHLAMQRREVDGATSSLNTLKTTQHDWLDNGLVRILVQLAPRRSAELGQVPAVLELARTP